MTATCNLKPQVFAMHCAAYTIPPLFRWPTNSSRFTAEFSLFPAIAFPFNLLSTVPFSKLLLLPFPIFSFSIQLRAYVSLLCISCPLRLLPFTVMLANRFSTSARFSSLAKWRFRIFSFPPRSQHLASPLIHAGSLTIAFRYSS